MKHRRLSFSVCFFLLILGCGSSEIEVKGKVTIEGVPLSDGEIIFEDSKGLVTPVGTKIKNGEYTVLMLPGAKTVKIQASRPAKKIDPVMGSAAKEARIGPEFNTQSKLTADIKPGPQPSLDFQVKELPK